MLKIGRIAPLFSLKDQHNELNTIKSYRGQWVLLYFYPKDDTPGCTKEACMITEVYKDFSRLKVKVLGVSKDSVRSHQKFAEKYQLPFTLLSDPTLEVIEKYGALLVKSKAGKETKSTNRISYLIDPEGKIAKAYPEVDPANHALLLLKDIKALQKAAKVAVKAETV